MVREIRITESSASEVMSDQDDQDENSFNHLFKTRKSFAVRHTSVTVGVTVSVTAGVTRSVASNLLVSVHSFYRGETFEMLADSRPRKHESIEIQCKGQHKLFSRSLMGARAASRTHLCKESLLKILEFVVLSVLCRLMLLDL